MTPTATWRSATSAERRRRGCLIRVPTSAAVRCPRDLPDHERRLQRSPAPSSDGSQLRATARLETSSTSETGSQMRRSPGLRVDPFRTTAMADTPTGIQASHGHSFTRPTLTSAASASTTRAADEHETLDDGGDAQWRGHPSPNRPTHRIGAPRRTQRQRGLEGDDQGRRCGERDRGGGRNAHRGTNATGRRLRFAARRPPRERCRAPRGSRCGATRRPGQSRGRCARPRGTGSSQAPGRRT